MSLFLAGLTLGSVLLGGALVVIVLLFLARPFATREDEATRLGREEIDALFLRKQSLLRDIRELDEDYESATIAPELYRHTRPQLVKQAAIIMRQLDDLGYVEATAESADTDAQIEAAVRRLRTPEQTDEQIEAAVRQARTRPAAQATVETATAATANAEIRFCPQCGNRVEPDDRFCPKCGRNLIPTAQAARA